MVNSLLLVEGIGVGYKRRLEIVDEAETNCFGPMEHARLENPFSAESFYLLTSDFTGRLLPEHHDLSDPCTPDVHEGAFGAEIDLGERFAFIRTVAKSITITPEERPILADLLEVQPVLLSVPRPIAQQRQPVEIIGYSEDTSYRRELTGPLLGALIQRGLHTEIARHGLPPTGEIAV